ncbi:MAG: PQQ-like beta-propeller repeat protein [Spirochaetes bacterium]|nr:PQQ-like beta-propeller repeat protein [Spirochaetota bacterium]
MIMDIPEKTNFIIPRNSALVIMLCLCACLTTCIGCKKKTSGIPLIPIGPTSAAPSLTYENTICCFGIFGSPVIDADSHLFIGSIRSAGETLTCSFFANPIEGASGLLHGIEYDGTPLAGFPYDSERGSVMATAIECAPILLADGSIIFGKDDGYMYRVNADGTLNWESPADDPFNPAAPIDDNEQMIPSPLLDVPNNAVVFLSHFSDVYGPGLTADAVAVFCPALDPSPFKTTATQWYSKLYALNLENGSRKWVFNPVTDPASGGNPMVGWGSPAMGSDGSYIICLMQTAKPGVNYVPTTGRVFAINPADGTSRWVYPAASDLDYSLWTSPVISPSGNIYIGASRYDYAPGARLYSLTPEGAPRWYYEFTGENTIAASPALLSDGTIIVATQNRHMSDPNQLYGRVYALTDNVTEAIEQWRYPSSGSVPCGFYSSPLVDANDRVYIANEPFPYQLGVDNGMNAYLIGLSSSGTSLFVVDLEGFVHGNMALGPDGSLIVPQRKPPKVLIYHD